MKENQVNLPRRKGALVDICQLQPGFSQNSGVGHHLSLYFLIAALDQVPLEGQTAFPPLVCGKSVTEVDNQTLHVAVGIWPLGWTNALSEKVPNTTK